MFRNEATLHSISLFGIRKLRTEKVRPTVLYFMECLFPDPENLVTPKNPLQTNANIQELDKLFRDKTYKEAMIALNNYSIHTVLKDTRMLRQY